MRNAWAFTAGLVVAATAGGTALADHVYHTRPAACEPGYMIVEEVCYKDVVCKVCKPAPDTKKPKKWVYSVKTEDFCLPKAPPHGCGSGHGLGHAHGCGKPDCGGCAECKRCGKVQCRNLLVKRQVDQCDEHTSKCVVETVVQRVPYTVYRKVPCTAPQHVVPGHPYGAVPPMPPAGERIPAPK
jgi:hypothetical protein